MTLILFLVFLFFFVFLPGRAFFQLSKMDLKFGDFILDLSFSLIFGTLFLIIVSIGFDLFRLPVFFVCSLPVISLFILYKSKKLNRLITIPPFFALVSLCLIIIFSLFQSFPMLKGYRSNTNSMIVQSIHDNLWNIAV